MRLQPNTLSNPMPFEPSPANGASSNSDPAGFSSLLRQTQVAAAPPPPPPPVPAPIHVPPAAAAPKPNAPEEPKSPEATGNQAEGQDNAPASEAADAPDANSVDHAHAPTKARARAGHGAAGNAASDELPAATNKSAVDAGAEAGAAGKNAKTHGGHADATLAAWLTGLHQPHTGAARTADAAGKTTAPDTAAADDTRSKAVAGAADNDGRGRELAAAAAVAGADARHHAETGASGFAALAAEAARADTGPAPSHAIDATGAAGALLAGAAPTPTGTAAAAAAPAAVGIPTPVDSPDFAQALGLQMSVLAKDGVQQAELHLNPADMGPVSVQIVMEGTQARIDFGADMAATRHAIEAGLPELASALRDAGFTLAGGGVSQHSQPRGDGQGGNGPGEGRARANGHAARQASADGAARAASAARRIVTHGGLDLYA
jgi:flagellar hook-length control protein FliK